MKELIDQLTQCPKAGGTYMVPDYLVSEIEQKFIAIRATVKKANENLGTVNDVVNGGMNKDLKWLAENVHKWQRGSSIIKKDDYGSYVFLAGPDPELYAGSGFTRAQWQAARDELSGKPSWDDAPEWARYLTQDEIGTWWFYESRPSCTTKYWHHHDGEMYPQQCNLGKVLGNWRNTLERRPENRSVETTEKAWCGPEDGLPTEHDILLETLSYSEDDGFFRKNGRKVGYTVKKKKKLYVKVYFNGKAYYAHRLAWFYVHGEWPKMEIDHINGDSEDNRMVNLRCVSRKDNCRNVKLLDSSKSGYCGVNWHEKAGKWRARVKVDGREHYVGLFDCPVEAAARIKSLREELGFHDCHGERRKQETK